MSHITMDLLRRAQRESNPMLLYARLQRHLSEICGTCKRAFRDHKLQQLSLRKQEWVLEPLHRTKIPEEAAEKLRLLRGLSPEERLSWAQKSSSVPIEAQAALVLALLLEARHAPEPEQVLHWAEVALNFLEINPVPERPARLLGILAATYKAEGLRRTGDPLGAEIQIRRVEETVQKEAVQDQSTLAEVHFLSGKIYLRHRPDWPTAEDHLSQAALLYAALGDDAHRAQALVLHACLLRKMEGDTPKGVAMVGAVDIALEALGLLEPEAHARLLIPILLDMAHAYCDRGEFHFAQEIQGHVSRLAPLRAHPAVRGRYKWLLARLAQARGDDEQAREEFRACSESVARPMMESLELLLVLRDRVG